MGDWAYLRDIKPDTLVGYPHPVVTRSVMALVISHDDGAWTTTLENMENGHVFTVDSEVNVKTFPDRYGPF